MLGIFLFNVVRSSPYYVKWPELTYTGKWHYINKTGFFFHFIWLIFQIWLISNLLPNMEKKSEKSNKRQTGTNDLGHVCLERKHLNINWLSKWSTIWFSNLQLLFCFCYIKALEDGWDSSIMFIVDCHSLWVYKKPEHDLLSSLRWHLHMSCAVWQAVSESWNPYIREADASFLYLVNCAWKTNRLAD